MDSVMKNIVKLLNEKNSSRLNRAYNYGRALTIPIKYIEPLIPEGKIVDVGCGAGIIAMYIAQKNKKRSVTGYDFNKYRIANLNRVIKNNKTFSRLKFYAKDFTKDSKIISADAVLMVDLLHHVDKETQLELLKIVKSKLNKGGVLIIKEIAKDYSHRNFITWLLDKIITKGDKIYYRPIKEWIELLNMLGYDIKVMKKIPNLVYPHFILICSAKKSH
jgi:2-polyprenyl-3-methyl-5-hydroxy-6-metoxy-1,4-benzoquinol methylase